MTQHTQDYDIAQIISNAPWFRDLPEDAKNTLITAARLEKHPKNSFLYAAGDIALKVHCLVEGRIRAILTSPQGQEFGLDDFKPITWVGEAMLFSDEREVLSLQFKESGKTVSLNRNIVLEVAGKHPSIYRNILKSQIQRNRGMYRLMGGMLFYPLKSRLAWRILYFLKHHSYEADGGTYLDIHFSQQDLARLVFGSRQRVNKIFKLWSEAGVVLVRDKKYFIPDVNRLIEEANKIDD
ncbi:hypothetical protein NBRC116188_30330 [Oceaniserpentilla sp. 4NH20-0058]|uniref:Crp/Fnr family transcriptional regulator n=1 Tax=Oceaniserpentilla sp. 4NH20-0058 TaxID=3127660 RepID=UPI00310A5641